VLHDLANGEGLAIGDVAEEAHASGDALFNGCRQRLEERPIPGDE
jgi:hypothetical protein